MCPEEVANVISIYFAILIIISFVMYSILLSVLFRIRRNFHPFFSILFGLVIFCYQICAAGVALQRIVYLIFGYKDGEPFKGCDDSCLEKLSVFLGIVDYIVNCSYSGITALFLSCLIERIVATLFPKKYEHSRHYFLLITLLLFTAAVMYFQGIENVTIGDDATNEYLMMGLSVAILVMLGVLFLMNMRRIKANDKTHNSLSYKYQLTENLRVVRNALIPVVLLDTSITINDMVGDMVFNKQFIFDAGKCKNNTAYPYAFVLMNTLSIALEYGIPLIILCRWEAFNKALPVCLKHNNKITDKENINQGVAIKNVFGAEINRQISSQQYFDTLNKDWNRV